MRRVRIVGLSLLALGVPAFAFGGEQAPSPGSLSVSASLGGCGLANATIVCEIDASWSALDGAEYYTVSVTRADGSVVDAGQSSGTSRSIYVPYVGPGTYSVQVSAWGTPPGEDQAEVLARDKSMSTAGNDRGDNVGTHPEEDVAPGEPRDPEEVADSATDTYEPAVPEPPPAEPPPVCEEEPPLPEEPHEEAVEPQAAASTDQAVAAAEPPAAEDEPDDPVCP
jgi:hypothetical protein